MSAITGSTPRGRRRGTRPPASAGHADVAWPALVRLHGAIAAALEDALQARHALSLTEFTALQRVAEQGERHWRMQPLAEAVGLSQSALSRLVARLEHPSRGVLRRYVCADDRRGVFTELTAEGERRLADATPTYEAALAAVWARLSEAGDVDALRRALDA
jgi:DNA-binding MarR family transcriptional regulator